MASRQLVKTPRRKTKVNRKTRTISNDRVSLSVNPIDEKKTEKLTTTTILTSCLSATNMMTMVEHKEIVPQFRGTDAPTSLCTAPLGYRYAETKESKMLVNTLRSMVGTGTFRFPLNTLLNMSSSGAGAINSTISNSAITSNVQFVALSAVFNEFFIKGFTVDWQPVSRYNYLLTGVTATSVANLPMSCADLQHGQTAYSSASTAADNFRFTFHNTGDPFKYSWKNTESPDDKVVVTTTAATQAWTSVGNVANYLGSLQFISQAAPPGLPVSQVAGTFAVRWDILMRVRI